MAANTRKLGTLSTGTLALKFMQRTAPGDSSTKVTLPQAKVKDEGEWEVAREVREGWGENSESMQNVTYEPSYLPFLLPAFAASSEPPAPGGGGRKSFGRFNKALEKPIPGEITDDMVEKPLSAADSASSSPPKSKSSKTSDVGFRRPKGISSVAVRARPPAPVSHDAALPKAAPQSFSKSSGKHHPPIPVFQRPAGVDNPSQQQKRKRRPDVEEDVQDGMEEEEDVGSRRVKKRKDKAPVEMVV